MSVRSGGYAPPFAARACSSFLYGPGMRSESFPGLSNISPMSLGLRKSNGRAVRMHVVSLESNELQIRSYPSITS